MCIDYAITCSCGSRKAHFNFRDEVLPVEVIEAIYCPACSGDVSRNPETMLIDNDWIIEYDMDVVRFTGHKIPDKELTPELVFDEGYCTWRGIYPTDYIDSIREREELVKLAKINPGKYLKEFKRWGTDRMERLANEGWRKANEGEPET